MFAEERAESQETETQRKRPVKWIYSTTHQYDVAS